MIIRKEPILTKHWRIQAQILHMDGYRLMWINCYLPTDPQTLQIENEELSTVLEEIENILDSNVYDDCLLGGDFNFDPRRNTGFANIVHEFLEKIGLKSVWDKFPIDFTHIHTDFKSTSILDHFFVNSSLLERIVDAQSIHLGDNISRHSPIMLKFQVPSVPLTLINDRQAFVPKMRRPAWYKASLEDKTYYHDLLNQKLDELPVPKDLACRNIHCVDKEHSMKRDRFVLDLLSTIIEFSYECIPLNSYKNTGKANHQPLPEWNSVIQPLKEDSLFWHAVWLSAGRPSKGGLHLVMSHVRSKYHRAVKIAKRNLAKMKNNELISAAELGNVEFIKQFQKHIFKKEKTCQQVPDCLEGKVTHDDILETFKQRYEHLYNSADTSEEMVCVKGKLDNLLSMSVVDEVSKITPTIVKSGSLKMKTGKTDASGSYSSDVFTNAPDILFDILANVFQSYLVHGTVTAEILSCTFIPLFKGGLKNPEHFDSYRGIAGASQLLKLFEYVILNIWGDILTTDTLQFGFKSGVSTTQCTWLVNEVTTYFMRRGTAVTACLLDCSKAFDKCRFDKLFEWELPAWVFRVLI